MTFSPLYALRVFAKANVAILLSASFAFGASSLPPVNSGTLIPQMGSSTPRAIGNWFGETASNRRVSPWGPIPLVAPSAITLGAAKGLYTVAKNASGSGYVTGDQVTLAGATCAYPPVVTVTASGGAVTAVSILTPGVCSVTNTAFTQASTTGTGTGATFTGSMQPYSTASMANPVFYGVSNSSTGNCLLDFVEPRWNIGSSGYWGSANAYIGTHATIECESDAPQLDFDVLAYNSTIDVLVDGNRTAASQLQTDSSGAGWVLTVIPATSGVHNYKIYGVNLGIAAVAAGSQYSVWSPSLPRRPLVFLLGDSYTFGTCAPGISESFGVTMGYVRGVDVLPDGIGSSGWASTGANAPQARVANDLALRTQAANAVEVDFALGYNDAGGNMATVTANVQASVAAVQSWNPNAKIVFIGPWTPLGPTGNLTTVWSTIQAAAAGYNNVAFVNPASIINTSNSTMYGCGDNVHPGYNGANGYQGHVFLGNRVGEQFGTIN